MLQNEISQILFLWEKYLRTVCENVYTSVHLHPTHTHIYGCTHTLSDVYASEIKQINQNEVVFRFILTQPIL